jgi:hypothetical protein
MKNETINLKFKIRILWTMYLGYCIGKVLGLKVNSRFLKFDFRGTTHLWFYWA